MVALVAWVVGLFVLLLILTVFLGNRVELQESFRKLREENAPAQSLESPILKEKYEQAQKELGDILDGSHLSPEDLDFWDQYPEEMIEAESEVALPEPTLEPTPDPSRDGKHTLLQYEDGTGEWVAIRPEIPAHSYDFTNLVSQGGLMNYFQEGKCISYVGADVSKLQEYIDFTKAKKAGLDFVMVRVGARGYSTGQLVIDEYFTQNAKRASDAGLQVGVYFTSRAISEEEAVEEARLVLETIADYHVTFPIAFCMQEAAQEESRIDELSKAERTRIANAFLDTVKEAGYLSLLYGTKEWLIKKVELSKLSDTDIWLSQPGDIPDYPYRFSMWQYNTGAGVDGIPGLVNLNLCFTDYTEK